MDAAAAAAAADPGFWRRASGRAGTMPGGHSWNQGLHRASQAPFGVAAVASIDPGGEPPPVAGPAKTGGMIEMLNMICCFLLYIGSSCAEPRNERK